MEGGKNVFFLYVFFHSFYFFFLFLVLSYFFFFFPDLCSLSICLKPMRFRKQTNEIGKKKGKETNKKVNKEKGK